MFAKIRDNNDSDFITVQLFKYEYQKKLKPFNNNPRK